MIALMIILMVLLAASVALNVKCIQVTLELREKHEELVDQIELSLDILDRCYNNIAKAVKTPVLSDDPVVRDLLIDMRRAKDAVLMVANRIVSFDQPNEETETDDGT